VLEECLRQFRVTPFDDPTFVRLAEGLRVGPSSVTASQHANLARFPHDRVELERRQRMHRGKLVRERGLP